MGMGCIAAQQAVLCCVCRFRLGIMMVVGEDVFDNRVRYQRLVENVNNVVRHPAQCDDQAADLKLSRDGQRSKPNEDLIRIATAVRLE